MSFQDALESVPLEAKTRRRFDKKKHKAHIEASSDEDVEAVASDCEMITTV
jgi:hypothetical protein